MVPIFRREAVGRKAHMRANPLLRKVPHRTEPDTIACGRPFPFPCAPMSPYPERPDDEPLARLAARLGLALELRQPDGTTLRVADPALRTLVEALGYEAETDTQVTASLARFETVDLPLITPVRLMTRSSIGAQELDVNLGTAGAHEVSWTLDLRTEDGTRSSHHGHAPLHGSTRFAVPYPQSAPLGYHELALTVTTGNQRWFGEQRWIVVPDACYAINEVLGPDCAFGVNIHLHSLRSKRGWGIGDLTDLRLLSLSLAAAGADFVALGPLHALPNHWPEINPYAPTSRLFGNPISIDVEAVPELAECHDSRSWLGSKRTRGKLEALRSSKLIDYDTVGSLKMQALRRLHRHFLRHHRRRDTPRGCAFEAFRAHQGPLLDAYAVFCAMGDLMRAAEGQPDWRCWPEPYQRPDSTAVRDFAEVHGELVDFHRYVQFELDRQLGITAVAAREAGMRIGITHELAMGSTGGGFDTWAFRELFAFEVDLGHPVGPLRPDGGRWALPPLIPDRLHADGYGYWSRLLRNAFRHAGGLRIDHILGLMRQRWIPRSMPDEAGTDLHPRSFDLFGILAHESRRAQAIVIGETLGHNTARLSETLDRWRIISTQAGEFGDLPSTEGPQTQTSSLVLAMARARDQPPLAAWWTGRDLALRQEFGHLETDREHTEAEVARAHARTAWVQRLVASGLIKAGPDAPAYSDLVRAINAALARTSARLVGVWMDDLLAEVEPAYLLDVPPERFPSWCRRAARPFATALADPDISTALRAARRPPMVPPR